MKKNKSYHFLAFFKLKKKKRKKDSKRLRQDLKPTEEKSRQDRDWFYSPTSFSATLSGYLNLFSFFLGKMRVFSLGKMDL